MRTLQLLCQGYNKNNPAHITTKINGAQIFKGAVSTSTDECPQIPIRIDPVYATYQIPVEFVGSLEVEVVVDVGRVVICDVLANFTNADDPLNSFGSLWAPIGQNYRHNNPWEININPVRTISNIVRNSVPVVQEFKHTIDNGVSLKSTSSQTTYTKTDIIMNGWPKNRRPNWLETLDTGDHLSYLINVFLHPWHERQTRA